MRLSLANHAARSAVFVAAFVILAGSPARAEITAELAKKCQQLMVKAHPTQWYTSKGNGAAQQAYFKECLAKNGDMPEPKPEPKPQPKPGAADAKAAPKAAPKQ